MKEQTKIKTEEEIIKEYEKNDELLSDRYAYEFYSTLRNDLIQIDWFLDNDAVVSDVWVARFLQRQQGVYWLAYSKRLPKTCEEYKAKTRALMEKCNENKARIAALPWYKRIFM